MSYPQACSENAGACIAFVEPGSPAACAGLAAGMRVLFVCGEPLRDILDWHWYADGYAVELEVERRVALDLEPGHRIAQEAEAQVETERKLGVKSSLECGDGQATRSSRRQIQKLQAASRFTVQLVREAGEGWGIEFSEVLFDGLRRCVNTCLFCFMKMLPRGMRPSLSVRDDDYRLSFLHGNFVTLTNLSSAEVTRIKEMQLSPLNVSLHAVDPVVRAQLMGSNHARGLKVLEQLLAAGIKCKAQIVLMPGINDGAVLEETLDWIACQPNITATGIVPYGYTRYAEIRQGFDTPQSARAVVRQVLPRAPQVQLADEFFIKAWPGEIAAHLPAGEYYGSYPLLEDGIGMLRQFLDNRENIFLALGNSALITGEAFAAVLQELWPESWHKVISIKNEFFGGNVDVAGLLTAEDIIKQVAPHKAKRLVLPQAMFNDDGLTLDNKTAADIAKALGAQIRLSSS